MRKRLTLQGGFELKRIETGTIITVDGAVLADSVQDIRVRADGWVEVVNPVHQVVAQFPPHQVISLVSVYDINDVERKT